ASSCRAPGICRGRGVPLGQVPGHQSTRPRGQGAESACSHHGTATRGRFHFAWVADDILPVEPPRMVRAVKPTPPSPEEEASTPLDDVLLADIEDALLERHSAALQDSERLEVDGATGSRAAFLRFAVGDDQLRHEGELFVRGAAGPSLDGALGTLVDFLDGLLDGWARGGRVDWLPLDWATYSYDQTTVWGRGDVRRPHLEHEADALLRQGHATPEE
ncbi:MAG: hypothetical protein ACO3JL_20040, partial [Myxococcota bacterium]